MDRVVRALYPLHGTDSELVTALGSDFKGRISILFYIVAIPFAFVERWIALAIYILVAVMWLIPDQRIEKTLAQ